MIIELRRSGGLTGGGKRWRVNTTSQNEAAWQSLVEAAGLRFRGAFGRAAGVLLVWVPGGASPHDLLFDIWVDGRRATIQGVDVQGSKHDLIDRIMREGDEVGS